MGRLVYLDRWGDKTSYHIGGRPPRCGIWCPSYKLEGNGTIRDNVGSTPTLPAEHKKKL
jgi:hypothetical protein